jgi:hypothetical protein
VAAFELGNLADCASSRTGGGADEHSLASYGLPDVEQPDPGRQPDRPQRTHVMTEFNAGRGVNLIKTHRIRTEHAQFRPCAERADECADRISRVVAFDHFAQRHAVDWLANFDRGQIAWPIIEKAANGGVHRKDAGFDEHLAGADLRARPFPNRESFRRGNAAWAGGEDDVTDHGGTICAGLLQRH